MSKNKNTENEVIINDDFINDNSIEDIISIETNIADDTDDTDIIDDDIDTNDKTDDTSTNNINEEDVYSKHRLEGKHALKYDTIFKGKKDNADELDTCVTDVCNNDIIEIDDKIEIIDNEKYLRQKKLREDIYMILSMMTDLNLSSNRRKPSKEDFNKYFGLLKTELKDEKYTNVEIFNELAVYFSENIFNMYRLLNKDFRDIILKELELYVGKNEPTTDIVNRNISVGTELEFKYKNKLDNECLFITGVVKECDYEKSVFKIFSYEKNYIVDIKNITKILNNKKFKYNLSKLENIDLF